MAFQGRRVVRQIGIVSTGLEAHHTATGLEAHRTATGLEAHRTATGSFYLLPSPSSKKRQPLCSHCG